MELKTKYKISDKVWVINKFRKAACITITYIGISVSAQRSKPTVSYSDELGFSYDETECFDTKEELLNSL